MHVLLTNDDGPPDSKASPYVQNFVDTIKSSTDWDLSIVVPHVQRSWIGKAHIIGKNITGKYWYSGSEEHFDTPQNTKAQEWILLSGTPATCANIGSTHLYKSKGPIDLVISGPNYGRNTSAPYILSSGTVGAALEAVMCGKRAIALSYSYTQRDHPEEHIGTASALALNIIEHLMANWPEDVQLYSVNIPLGPQLSSETPARYVPILEHKWSKIFNHDDKSRLEFSWKPDFAACDASVRANGPGTDAFTVTNGEISVTPLIASFKPATSIQFGELLPLNNTNKESTCIRTYINTPDKYVVKCWESQSISLVSQEEAEFVYEDYDVQDFEHRRDNKLYYAYVIRKGLIRKNYLANMVAYYCAKNPDSILKNAFPETFNLELDYAEFLDDSLDEAYELRQEIEMSGQKNWILKPAMGDRGEGIHIFKTIEGLQQIMDHMGDDEDGELPFRHFIVQEYLTSPLLVDSRKFHIRTYIVCIGALRVYVYSDMLALFAATEYKGISSDQDLVDMEGHLTNTCAQNLAEFDPRIVQRFADLGLSRSIYENVVQKINSIVHDVFAAATADPVNFQPLPNAIEFFGLDFLVNDRGDPQLLEINAYPDFAQTGKLQALVEGLFESTLEVIQGYFGCKAATPHGLELVFDQNIR